MKRSLKLLSLLLLLVVVMTGCGKKDPKTQLENALEKMEDVKGVTLKMDANIEATSEGTTMTMAIGMNGDFYGEGKEAAGHYTANISLFGMNQEVEMYTEVKDGYVYNYTKSEDGWTYTKNEYKETEFEKDDLTEILDKAKTIKEEKSDKDGYTKLVVTVSKETINEAMKDESVASALDSEESVELKEDFSFNVYLKDGYVSIVEIDLGKVIMDSMTSEETEGNDMKATLTVELTNYNKVEKITVPEEVTKNAKEETAISSDLPEE